MAGDAASDAPGGPEPRGGPLGKGLAVAVALVVIALDLWTKAVVFDGLENGRHRWLLGGEGGGFGFTKVWNPGTMWGQFQSLSDYLPWVRVVAAVIVAVMILTTPSRATLMLAALGLVLGGALGNIYDGFEYGMVRDFVMVDLGFYAFDPFPIFNVADSAICVGVAILALTMWLRPPEGRPVARRASEEAAGRLS